MSQPVLALAGLIAGTGLAGLIWLFGYAAGMARERRRGRPFHAKRNFGLGHLPDDPDFGDWTK